MISLILPYWDRQEAADKAIQALAEMYPELDLEVVIVDDGNATPYMPPDVPLNIKRVARPYKEEPSSCISAWNEGVREASGDIIVLSCIEVLHTFPVLEQMQDELERQGQNGYVLAAAWCPDSGEWHCHSTQRSAAAFPLPAGTGRSFLGMMRKSLFWRAEGFDEDYAAGAGYEDVDFIYRLLSVGAKFVMRDDLVVTHPKAGATIRWRPEQFERNKALLFSKWPQVGAHAVTVVCLKAGDAFGPEYVNILHDMVRRNLPVGFPGRFVCLTDDPSGLDDGIETLPLPADLEKWWGKLYLFKRGLFRDGERVAFFDLDTVITGSLDGILRYEGDFATLNDFYQPARVGPAVMMWQAGGPATAIWDEWEEAGKPRNRMGDLWWINQLHGGAFAASADKLQALYPGAFVSFKAHCHPHPPAAARVVCFHGLPRPHQATEEWVKETWRIGGLMASGLQVVANTAAARVAANVRYACTLDVPWLPLLPEHDFHAVLVGGGPSLKHGLDEIRRRVAMGAKVFATNNAFSYLRDNGIDADYHVLVDARGANAAFIKPGCGAHYLLASQCAREVFDAAAGEQITLMHLNTTDVLDSIPPAGEKPVNLISAGTTVGLAAMSAAYCLGFRKLHLYGYDSSYTEDHHAYPQSQNDADRVVEVLAGGRTFKAAPWMVMQAQQFQELAKALADADCVITVAGDGLLPHIAREMSRIYAEEQEAA